MSATEMTGPVRIVSAGTPRSTAVYVGDCPLPGVLRVTWEADAGGGPARAVVHLTDVALDVAVDGIELLPAGRSDGAAEADDPEDG